MAPASLGTDLPAGYTILSCSSGIFCKKAGKAGFFGTSLFPDSFWLGMGRTPRQFLEKGEGEYEQTGGRGIEGCAGYPSAGGICASLLLHVVRNELHVYFLSNLGQGGPPSFIHRIAQDVQEGTILNRPLG
jgi:hypothetical protein